LLPGQEGVLVGNDVGLGHIGDPLGTAGRLLELLQDQAGLVGGLVLRTMLGCPFLQNCGHRLPAHDPLRPLGRLGRRDVLALVPRVHQPGSFEGQLGELAGDGTEPLGADRDVEVAPAKLVAERVGDAVTDDAACEDVPGLCFKLGSKLPVGLEAFVVGQH
ncbi:MAG: hypothetical protein ACK559_38410, partial [bacterium]